MSEGEPSLLDALRNEEYTGENRCTPCTVLNVLIAAVLAAVAAAAAKRLAGPTTGRVTGLVLAGVFAAAIYLRGYLVPGTPTITKEYFPDEVLRLFDKHPASESGSLAFEEQIAERIEDDRAGSDSGPSTTTWTAVPTDAESDRSNAPDDAESDRSNAPDDADEGTDRSDASRESASTTDAAQGTTTDRSHGKTTDEAHGTTADRNETDAAAGTDDQRTDDSTATDESASANTDDPKDATESASADAEDPNAASEAEEPEWETVEKIEDLRENAVDPEQFLQDVGAVGPCEDRDDLCLTDEFAAAIETHMEGLEDRTDVDEAVLAELFDTDAEDIEFEDREYPAFTVGRRVRKWATDGALLLDVATHQALRETSDRWMDVPLEQRVDLLESLRTFQESCPSCGGAVAFGEEMVESCCATYEVIAYRCVDCGQHLVELDPTKIEEGKGIEA